MALVVHRLTARQQNEGRDVASAPLDSLFKSLLAANTPVAICLDLTIPLFLVLLRTDARIFF